jgi:hypothetical protein
MRIVIAHLPLSSMLSAAHRGETQDWRERCVLRNPTRVACVGVGR